MTRSNPIDALALAGAKRAFSARRARLSDARRLIARPQEAISGDLVLARIERVGRHETIQLAAGRSSVLHRGDLVVMPCGGRYAVDQFEGEAELDPEGCDMLAGGGVLGRMTRRHARMSDPTRAVPLGLLADGQGRALNLARYALPARPRPPGLPVIAALGSSMNAGKTTAAASAVRGLARGGRKVAALKVTGTGSFGDLNAYLDASAALAADFTDAGMASTWRMPLARIADGFDRLLAEAAAQGCDVAVVEFADGILQRETAGLLRLPRVAGALTTTLLAVPDALSAVGGCAALRAIGLPIAGVTGTLTRAPLACDEAAEATGAPILSRAALQDPACIGALLDAALAMQGDATPRATAGREAVTAEAAA